MPDQVRHDGRTLDSQVKKFGTEIVVISEIGSEKLDSQEVFEEIIFFLYCYSMKLYSKRKKAH